MSKKTDTYFIKKQKKPREIASIIFPKPKKTIIEPIKLSVLPADRLDDYTLTPYDIDPVDGLPTVEYLQENPDLISMVQGPARGMLQTKLRKGKELAKKSQEALIDLPNILEENKQDRQKGIIALLNVMDSLPARIRANLIQNINQAQGSPALASTPPVVAPPPPSPPPLLLPVSPAPTTASSSMVSSRPVSPPPLGASGTTVGQDEKDAFDRFKSGYDNLSADQQKEVLRNLRDLLGLKGQSKREKEIFKEMQSQPLNDLQSKYSAKEVRLKGAKYDAYKDVMKPYSVYGMGLKKKGKRTK